MIHSLLEQLKAKSPVLPTVTQEEADEVQLRLQEARKDPPSPERPGVWRKRFAMAAAALCLVLLVFPIASGTPFIQKLVAKWNEDFFWIETPGTPVELPEDYAFQTDNPGLQQLYDAVTELGITEPVVPMWLPEGFEIVSIEIITGNNTKILSYFAVDNVKFAFYIEERKSNVEQFKSFDCPEIWEYVGIKHFCLSNHVGTKVVWNNGNYDMTIVSTLDKNVVESIVQSIYNREEGKE